jgi:glycosyltransferase involved in cell wall biosynthesis
MSNSERQLTQNDHGQSEDPKISVIIPTYNEEEYIRSTLKAVENQKCTFPYEVIIVDGQSSDKTVEIAKNYGTIFIADKRGKVPQLNFAAKKTNSELFLFLDADTILIDPLFIQKIYKKFRKDENLFACSARFKYYDGNSISIHLGPYRFIITRHFFLNIFSHLYYFFKDLFGYPELTGMNLAVRKPIFERVKGFKNPPNSLGIDKTFSDSILYLTKLLNEGKIKTLNYLSVLTSSRHLTVERSIKRVKQYFSEKETYRELAKDI